MNEKRMSLSKLEAQARACRDVLQLTMNTVFVEKRPADRVLNSFLREHKQFGARDRRLLGDVVFAVFRWWGALRKLFDKTELYAMENEVPEITYNGAAALILGAMVMEKRELPEVAAIWMKELGLRQSEVNDLIVTGKASDGLDGWRVLNLIRASLRRTSTKSMKLVPLDMVPEWFPKYLPPGINHDKLAQWMQRRPPMWLRVQVADATELANKLHIRYGLKIKTHPLMKNSLCVAPTRINLFTLEEYRTGLFEVQDLASQVIGMVCSPNAGERWWDACAGAGGKTLQLADLMKRKGVLVATDIRSYKLDDLRKRAKRSGFPNIECREWNGKSLRSKQHKAYDGVLADAPCSCSGTWRRNTDARWSTAENEITEMAELQLSILQNVSSGVKDGGILVYATCSICEPENRGVVEKFLAANPDFELEKFNNPLTGESCDGMLQVFPWDGDCDAMFAARMRRR
ncbi:MAG: RsmB/NOP family class I SAM-dependent RNA methyltransferase [Victivallaceae bacterium]|nr:RsmB/NOP family class I SAM-dependent RNA methyltransferase [Victivallaceae bacterium]